MELDDRFADASEFPTSVEVKLADGEMLEQTVPLAMGKLARWMSRSDLKVKFGDCASAAMGTRQQDAVFNRLVEMDSNVACERLFAGLRDSGAMDISATAVRSG